MARDDTSTEGEAEAAKAEAGLLDSRPVRFALIYVLPALVCLLAGSAIYVSRMSVDRDVHLLAQPEWRSGGRAAVRVVGYDERGEPMDRLEVSLVLERPGAEPVELASVAGPDGLPAVDLDLEVPAWPAGPCRLRASVATPSGREVVASEVVLADAPPSPRLRLPSPPGDRPRGDTSRHALDDELGVELLPYGHALVPNLTNVLFVRTTDPSGRPVSAELRLALAAGLLRDPVPESVRTDRTGLAALTVHPMSNDLELEVSLPGAEPAEAAAPPDGPAEGEGAGAPGGGAAGGRGEGAPPDGGGPVRPRHARIRIATTPAQLVLRLARPLVEAGSPLELRVDSLHAARPVYLDLYSSGRWVLGRTLRLSQNHVGLRVPPPGPGLAFVQVYASPLEVGRGFSSQHLYALGPGEEPATALRALLRRLELAGTDRAYVRALLADPGAVEGGGLGQERLAALLLSRLDQGYVPPERLVSSAQVRSAALVEFQSAYRLRISLAIGLLGLVVTLLIAYGFGVAALRARERRLLWESTTGGREEDLYLTSMGKPKGLDRVRGVVQIGLMVGVVAAGFLLIAVLVSVMAWYGQ